MNTTNALSVTLSLALISGVVLSPTSAQEPSVGLIPWPKSIKIDQKYLDLTEASRIVYADEQLRPLADILRQELYLLTDCKLSVSTGTAHEGDILLKFDKLLEGEAHTVSVDDRVTIAGSDYKHTAMASATLLQAIERNPQPLKLPRMQLENAPHSDFRCLMIDIARHPHTIDTIKQCILLCRVYKVSMLQLHLNDDQSFAFECKAFPKLATPGHHFTQQELRDLVAFADARGVTLVPEFDAPGHTTSLRRAMPELFGRPGLSVVNLGKEEVFSALETIAGELCDIFDSSPYFHLGADEAYLGELAKDEIAQQAVANKGYESVQELFYEYIVRMNAFVKSQGKQSLMWESFRGTGSKRVEIPRDILVMAWETAYQLPQSLLKNGYDIVNVSWKPCYLTPGWRWDPEYIYRWNMYRWENHWPVAPSFTPIQLPPHPKNRIRGGMMCSWESRDEMEVSGLRLRVPPWLERIWAPEQELPFEHFKKRFASTDAVFQRLISPVEISAAGLTDPDYVGPFYNREHHFGDRATVSVKPMLKDVRIHYTLDGSIPTNQSLVIDSQLAIDKTAMLRCQAYDISGQKLGHTLFIPYEHHPISGQVDGLLMQFYHDNGRGKHRTKFGKTVVVTLKSHLSGSTVRYTTNGQAPNSTSARYEEPIRLHASGVVVAQCFDSSGQPIGKPWRRSFEQVDATTNLTTGKPVTASDSANSNTLPTNAVDGIVDRNVHWDSSAGAPQWWRVDLEASHKLNRVQVVTYWDDHRYYQYTVEVSLDGQTWNQVVDFSDNERSATPKGYIHDFDSIVARYIRVTMLRNSANPGLHLVEVRAFSNL